MNVKAVIFDWAGTTVDFGSLCPVSAFQSSFAARGVTVTSHDIQRFMGIGKREHIGAILALPEVATKWEFANHHAPMDEDVDALYKQAEELIVETIPDFAIPTPHLLETVASLRSRGLKVGSTTGYTAAMMERLVPTARQRGFAPDDWVASDEVSQGRPWPWMIFKTMERLGICPPAAVVKVGDTVADVAEALSAGTWAVGVVESSSLIGRKQADLESLPASHREMLIRKARRQFAQAGAHFVINNLSELEDVIATIESRLDTGKLPPSTRHSSGRVSIDAGLYVHQ